MFIKIQIAIFALLLLATGCATGVGVNDSATFTFDHIENETTIAVPGTPNRLLVSGHDENTVVGICDKDNRVRVGAHITKSGKPGIAIYDSEYNASINATLSPTGQPWIMLTDKSKMNVVLLEMQDKQNLPLLIMQQNNREKGPLTRLGVMEYEGLGFSAPVFDLKANGHKSSYTVAFSNDQRPVVTLKDSMSRTRLRFGVDKDDNGYIEILDAEGNVKWGAR